MPELPEVETIRRGLSDFIVKQKILGVEVSCEKSFIGPREIVLGREILRISRRGKALLIELSGGITMMIHLRMTGQLIYRDTDAKGYEVDQGGNDGGNDGGGEVGGVGKDGKVKKTKGAFAGGHPTDSFFAELPDRQTRVWFQLERGRLFFNDQRKFGFCKVIPTEEVEKDKFIASLGKEPWETSAEELYAVFQRRKGSPVKGVILDQKVIAGIGNIYADEALFYAGVYPGRLCGGISLEETRKIIEGACKSMDASIDSGGSTMATYVRADGTKGNYLEKFAQVFRREGEPCLRCGEEIRKTRVVGRGTHYCPRCQEVRE